MQESLKEIRIRHNMSMKQLSDYTGIPYRTIQNWDSGIRKCPDYVLDMVIDKLDNKLPEIKNMLENDLETETNIDVMNYIIKLLNLINS